MAQPRPEVELHREHQLIELYRSNPWLAAHDLLVYHGEPVNLQWYQVKVLKSLLAGTPFVMLVMSRGLGKTWLLAVYLILAALLWPHERLGIVGPSYRQSKFLFRYIESFWEESPYLQASSDGKPLHSNDLCELKLKNKSSIMALPLGDGEKIRGARFGRLVVDESARVDKAVLETVLIPFLTVRRDFRPGKEPGALGNQLILSTTAYYQFNWSYQYYVDWKKAAEKQPDKYNVFTYDFRDAIGGHIDENMIAMSARTMPASQFAMEYLSLWVKDSEGFYPASLIEHAKSHAARVELYGHKDAQYVLGIDPGDSVGAMTLIRLDIPSRVVYTKAYHNSGWHSFVEEIWRILRTYDVVAVGLDTKGGGSTVRDMLARGGSVYVGDEPVYMPPIVEFDASAPSKDARRILHMVEFSKMKELNDANFAMKAAFENHELLLPDHPRKAYKGVQIGDLESFYDEEFDDGLYRELRMVTATPTRTGYLHFETPRDVRKDRYSSLLIAYYAMRQYLSKVNATTQKKQLPVGAFVASPWFGQA